MEPEPPALYQFVCAFQTLSKRLHRDRAHVWVPIQDAEPRQEPADAGRAGRKVSAQRSRGSPPKPVPLDETIAEPGASAGVPNARVLKDTPESKRFSEKH